MNLPHTKVEDVMAIVYRAIAVLGLSDHVPDFCKEGRSMVQGVLDHATTFVNADPLTDEVTKALDDLDTAEVAASGKGKGTAEARNTKKGVARKKLQKLRNFVQDAADASPEKAEEIITSAGMTVRRVRRRQRQKFEVEQGEVSGLVILIAALAAAKASYFWEWSTDQVHWTAIPMVFVTKTSISGLTPATMYYFRYHAVTGDGVGDMSQILSLLVK